MTGAEEWHVRQQAEAIVRTIAKEAEVRKRTPDEVAREVGSIFRGWWDLVAQGRVTKAAVEEAIELVLVSVSDEVLDRMAHPTA